MPPATRNQPLVRALLCGTDMPTVAVDALVPADPWAVRTDTVELDHSPSAALQPPAFASAREPRRTTIRRLGCAGSPELQSS